MASSDAQKSAVHQATEDSTTEPSSAPAAPRGPDARADSDSGRGRTGNEGMGERALASEAARLKARPDSAEGVPGSFERGAATAEVRPDTDADANAVTPPGVPVIGGGPGAGDASSGGGAGAGIPGGGTDLRTDGAFSVGDVDEDRRKVFPNQPGQRPGKREGDAQRGSKRDETAVGKDPDPSSYGGPVNLDDPEAV